MVSSKAKNAEFKIVNAKTGEFIDPSKFDPTKAITKAEYGAAECITGSKDVLSIFGHKILQDVGMDYFRPEQGLYYQKFLFEPNEMELLILSHAHADHMGALHRLVKQGFNKKIFATKETYELAMHQLRQEKDGVWWFNKDNKENPKRKGRFSHDSTNPEFDYKAGDWIYPFKQKITDEELDAIANLFVGDAKGKGIPFKQKMKLASIVDATFYEAGHMPGSAQIQYDITTPNGILKYLTMCDFGRTDHKVLQHPTDDIPLFKYPETEAIPKDLDYILTEATYGNKAHRPFNESIDMLRTAIKDAYDRKSVLVLPAFSIHRTQLLKYMLFNLYREGSIPEDFKIYVNSPSADEVEEVILNHLENVDAQAIQDFKAKNNPFNFPNLVYVKEGQKDGVKHQTAFKEFLDQPTETGYAVLSASGMCDMGRIVPVLKRTIQNEKNIILMTGYCSPSTRGAQLLKGATEIDFGDSVVKRNAEVRRMGGLSGHADGYEIVEHLKCLHDPKAYDTFKGILIKHGELEACEGLKELVLQAGYPKERVHVMKKGWLYVLE